VRLADRGPLAWGILSTARITEDVLPAMEASEIAYVRAIASRDIALAKTVAAARAIPAAYGSYEELLADDSIDCVYVPLPNALHGRWTRAALEAGKHVLCEKPLTPTRKEAETLFDLAKERGLLLMEGFMYRHHPMIKRLHDIVTGGQLGEIQVIRSWFHFKVPDPATDICYSAQLAGGALHDVGCYCISLASYLYGRAPDVSDAVSRMAPSGVDEIFGATQLFGTHSIAVFDCGFNSPLHMGVQVTGTRGHAIVETPWYPHLDQKGIVLEIDGTRRLISAPGANSYRLEIENFCAAVAGRANLEVSRAETLRNLDTMERLARAARMNTSRQAA
jgi:xylose dehydrogenase (NAD/NADP)